MGNSPPSPSPRLRPTPRGFEVTVIGPHVVSRPITIYLCDTEEQMEAITVLQLKLRIFSRRPDFKRRGIVLIFDSKVMADERTLVSYGVGNKSVIEMSYPK
ncbi:unnamed protein product, partial [Gadus morhua 'NCC']